MEQKESFVNDIAKNAWQLFEKTGEIGYYELFKNIQTDPYKDLDITKE